MPAVHKLETSESSNDPKNDVQNLTIYCHHVCNKLTTFFVVSGPDVAFQFLPYSVGEIEQKWQIHRKREDIIRTTTVCKGTWHNLLNMTVG